MGELPCPTHNIIGLRFSPDGKHLSAISQRQNEVYVWDVAARTPARTIRAPNRVWSAMPLSGGARVALAGEQGLLVIAAVDSGQVVRSIPVRDKPLVYGLGLSTSGQWLSGVVGGRAMIVVDLDRGDSIRIADADQKMQLSATEFSPDDLFVIARGSSFLPPKMVEVGAHPEGAEPAAPTDSSSYAGCSAAIVATGLIGYAICAAIVSSSAPSNDPGAATRAKPSSDDDIATKRAPSGPSDGQPTVDITGLSAELMLWRLSDPQPIVAKTFGRTFEQMGWSKDATKVALVANGIQDGELVKRVLIYQRSHISARSSALPPPVESLTLGRVGNLSLSAIASDQATLFMARSQPALPPPGGAQPGTAVPSRQKYTIERWPIPTLRTAADGAVHSAAATSTPPPH
jgi:hypothetical protein